MDNQLYATLLHLSTVLLHGVSQRRNRGSVACNDLSQVQGGLTLVILHMC
jgi:hypothetical protein